MTEDIHFDRSGPGPHYTPPRKVHYPESNGLPLAETRFQWDSLIYAAGALDVHFRDRPDVAVEGYRLLYYVEGDPRSRVAPDVFVVFGVPKRRRRTYLLWEEGKAPDFVLEVTSRSTRWIDRGFKRDLYTRLGVREYWLFDPTGDWLDPRLQGNRLSGGRYETLSPTGIEGGERVLHSTVLGLDVYVDRGEIRFRDPTTDRKLLTLEETTLALEEVQQARRKRERAALALEDERHKRTETELALEDERRERAETDRALEDARRKRVEADLALKEARARIAELEGKPPAEPSPPPRPR